MTETSSNSPSVTTLATEDKVALAWTHTARFLTTASKLPELPAGSRVLGFNYDTGERYLSVPDFLPVE